MMVRFWAGIEGDGSQEMKPTSDNDVVRRK